MSISQDTSIVGGAAESTLGRPSYLERFLSGPWPWLLPAIFMLLIFRLYPIVSQFQISMTDMNVSSLSDYDYVGFDNYEFVLKDKLFTNSFRFTLKYTILGVIGQFIVGFGLAMLMDLPLFGRTIYRLAILASWSISSLVVGYIWRLMLGEGRAGVLNAWLLKYDQPPVSWLSVADNAQASLVMVNIWRSVAFTMVFMLAGLQTIPKDLLEAATVDGANAWQRLVRIKIPFMRSLIVINIIFISVATFNVYEQILVITNGNPGRATETVGLKMYDTAFGGFYSGSLGLLGRGAAMGNIMFAVTLLFTVAYLWFAMFRKEDA